ncbi:hypothetical protein BH09VER1_BH09VER1_55500 [soil metagenome]
MIIYDYRGNWLEVRKFPSNTFEQIDLPAIQASHRGADKLIMQALSSSFDPGSGGTLTSRKKSLQIHRIVFAAEEARVKGNRDFSSLAEEFHRMPSPSEL